MPPNAPAHSSRALFEAAQVFTMEVLRDFEEERWQLFPLHAGAAVEFLAKAALAEENPLLLADAAGNLASTLIALQTEGVTGEGDIRTVSLDGAVARLRALHPQLKFDKDDVRALSAARNAAVHLGAKSRERLSLLLIFVRGCSELLALTSQRSPRFWGLYRRLPESIKKEKTDSQSEARIRILMAHCRAGDPQQREVREARARSAAAVLRRSHEEVSVCPICQCEALFGGDYVKVGGTMHFQPEEVHCHGCELRLKGADSLRSAGVAKSWPTGRSEQDIAQSRLWVHE